MLIGSKENILFTVYHSTCIKLFFVNRGKMMNILNNIFSKLDTYYFLNDIECK